MTVETLSGFLPSCFCYCRVVISSRHLICWTCLLHLQVSLRAEVADKGGRKCGGKCVEPPSIYCQTFDANVQIAAAVDVFEIWSHFIPAHSASAPRTSHTIKKTRRPEFSSNEFLIKESLFFHIFYFFCSKFTHSLLFGATELYVPCPKLNGRSKFGCQFCIHFPKY